MFETLPLDGLPLSTLPEAYSSTGVFWAARLFANGDEFSSKYDSMCYLVGGKLSCDVHVSFQWHESVVGIKSEFRDGNRDGDQMNLPDLHQPHVHRLAGESRERLTRLRAAFELEGSVLASETITSFLPPTCPPRNTSNTARTIKALHSHPSPIGTASVLSTQLLRHPS